MRNVNVVVLDVNPIQTDNRTFIYHYQVMLNSRVKDNITYYKCDVSKWEEVDAVSKKVIQEVIKVPLNRMTRRLIL